ncbi:MAG: hypothetical protein QM766_12680 [Burkholderiaceae bacterium]
MRTAFLIIALGATLGGCASAPSVSNQPKAGTLAASIADETRRIVQAFDIVEADYYEKVRRSTLDEACLDALGAPRPAVSDPSSIRMAIASALLQRLDQQPSQALRTASEPCLRKAMAMFNRHSDYMDEAEFREL